jgi:hypothetical protein
MTDTAGRPPADQLDAYLDRLLDPIAAAAFERAAEDDETLARELELQEHVDAALGRVMRVPSREDLARLLPAEPEAPVARIGTRTSWRRWAVAASVLLTVAGAWLIWSVVAPPQLAPSPYRLRAPMTITAFYEAKVDDGFVPDWRCEDDAEFREAFKGQLGQALSMREAAGVTALGVGYCHTLSPGTMYVLTQVAGSPVIVFVDTEQAVPETRPAAGDGLYLHEGRAGGLVLLELSPFDRPQVLDLLFDPASTEDGP